MLRGGLDGHRFGFAGFAGLLLKLLFQTGIDFFVKFADQPENALKHLLVALGKLFQIADAALGEMNRAFGFLGAVALLPLLDRNSEFLVKRLGVETQIREAHVIVALVLDFRDGALRGANRFRELLLRELVADPHAHKLPPQGMRLKGFFRRLCVFRIVMQKIVDQLGCVAEGLSALPGHLIPL